MNEPEPSAPADCAGLQGWVFRFTATEPRLSEAQALYEELGFEVKRVPAKDLPQAGGCTQCFSADVMALFTRK